MRFALKRHFRNKMMNMDFNCMIQDVECTYAYMSLVVEYIELKLLMVYKFAHRLLLLRHMRRDIIVRIVNMHKSAVDIRYAL